MIRIAAIGAILAATCALASDEDQRAKLTGSWEIQTSGATAGVKDASAYTLQPSQDGMRISGTDEGKVIVEVNCKMAQECKIKDEGHSATVMMYFNGPKLVENETIGSRVIRKRYSVTDDGNTMQIEVIPIQPEGKTEVILFKRAAAQSAKQ
jgi:hypothetical protein